MSTQTFNVVGMTCDHCVNSITEEVSEVAGVTHVDVVLETGVLTVTADDDVTADDIKAAVVTAGYTVTD
jgi:copper ion binding protein